MADTKDTEQAIVDAIRALAKSAGESQGGGTGQSAAKAAADLGSALLAVKEVRDPRQPSAPVRLR